MGSKSGNFNLAEGHEIYKDSISEDVDALFFDADNDNDLDIFSSALNRLLELSSVSTFDSFQAERLQLRYINKKGKKQNQLNFLHK